MISKIIRQRQSMTTVRYLHRSNNLFSQQSHDSQNDFTGSVSRLNRDRTLKHLLECSTGFIDTKPQHEQDEWATLPYVEGTVMSGRGRKELDIDRPRIDPTDTSMILFPSDGVQFVGMAKSLESVPAAKDLFDYASEILKYDLLKLCNKGPKSQLNDIRYSNVAIMTTCLANLELLREERPNAIYNCVGAAGFSLGEITALVFAGAFQFEEAIRLVQIRAEAIEAVDSMYDTGMAQICFGPDSKVIEACKKAKEWCIQNNVDHPECRISSYLYPRFKQLSGSKEAIEYLEKNYHKFRLRWVNPIRNRPALHCALMEPTVEPMKSALNQMNIADPIIRVYSNVTGRPYFTAEHIRNLLPVQLVRPVKWEQTMTYLYARRRGVHFPRTIICGPGYNFRTMLREVNSKAWRQSIYVGDQ